MSWWGVPLPYLRGRARARSRTLPEDICSLADGRKTHLRGEPKGAEELLRIAYKPQLLPVLNQEVNERYAIPPSPVTITYTALPLDQIEDALQRSVAMQIFCCLRTRIPRAFTGKYPSLMQPALRIFPPKGRLNRTASGEERADEVRFFSVRFNKF